MNLLIGEKLSIITSKQTTRHRILGILNEKDYQIVFSDTPGIIKPSYKLHQILGCNLTLFILIFNFRCTNIYGRSRRKKIKKLVKLFEKIKVVLFQCYF